ncbi:sel1 repeat family protein [Pelomyxa schiedti]|nr:sel1 repeat family protein [Pelomyxa schiedti]
MSQHPDEGVDETNEPLQQAEAHGAAPPRAKRARTSATTGELVAAANGCLSAFAEGDCARAYLLSLSLLVPSAVRRALGETARAAATGGESNCGADRGDAIGGGDYELKLQRHVEHRILVTHNRLCEGTGCDSGCEELPAPSSALGQIAWLFLVRTDPRLLQPLWPLDVAVTSKRVMENAKLYPLWVQLWMLEFLECVIATTSTQVAVGDGSTSTVSSEPGGNKSNLNNLAHFLLGVALSKRYGPWPFTDEAKSLEHIKIAADGGDQRAQYRLWRVQGEKSIDYLHRAASQRYCPALFRLGKMTLQGLNGQPLNPVEGLRLLQSGVEQGHAACQFVIASRQKCSDEELFRLIKSATDQGLPIGQFLLAQAHYSGINLAQKNDAEVLRLLKLSAAQGHAELHYMLGILLLEGLIVEQNYHLAVKFLSEAANAGNHLAQYHLAICYSEGTGVEQDKAEAFRLYQQASEGGIAQAHMKLAAMYIVGTSATPTDFTQVAHHLRLALKKDRWNQCLYAAWVLGELTIEGLIPGTTREAMELFYKAQLSQNDQATAQDACESLGKVYEEGRGGTTVDVREAVRWYRLAGVSLQTAVDKLEAYLHPQSDEVGTGL